MMQTKKWVQENLKLVIISALVFAGLILFAALYLNSPKPMALEDKCGQFVNLFSHSIPDEDSCKRRCRSQCESTDKSYKKVDFEIKERACNTCLCYCS